MKKGFTLVELLAVIVLLGGILTLAMTLLTGQIRDREDEISEAELKMYCAAAKLYIDRENTHANKEKIYLKTLEEHNILSNLDEKHKDKYIYAGHWENYFCCCTGPDEEHLTCNNDICLEPF